MAADIKLLLLLLTSLAGRYIALRITKVRDDIQESRDVTGKPCDAAVNFDRRIVCMQLFVSLIHLILLTADDMA